MKKDEVKKFRAKVTFEFQYSAEPIHYAGNKEKLENLKVEDMIKMDKDTAEEDIFLFLSGHEDDTLNIEITEVIEE